MLFETNFEAHLKSDQLHHTAKDSKYPQEKRHVSWRAFWRLAGWLVVSAYLVFISLVILTRYWLFPQIERQIPFIEQQISSALQTEVKIGHIQADWHWINPRLSISDLTLARPGHEASLTLPNVTATLSWRSLYRFAPSLSRLVITRPNLKIKRFSETEFDVAGFVFDTKDSENQVGESISPNRTIVRWLESQDHVEIIGGQFEYTDYTQADVHTLRVKDTNFLLHQHLVAWSFGLQTKLESNNIDSPIDVRGKIERKVFGDSLDPNTWSGRFFVDIAQVDFKHIAKRIGMERIVESGFGKTQFWFEFEEQKLSHLTVDLVLDDVKLRLSETSAPLLLDHLSGRFEEVLDGNHFELKTKDVIVTQQGFNPHYLGDVTIGGHWQNSMLHNGYVEVALVDLHTMGHVVSAIPLPESIQNFIEKAHPYGLVENISVQWEGPANAPTDFFASAKFDALTISDSIPLNDSSFQTPGFKNLTGTIEIDNDQGLIVIDSKKSVLSFPGIFFEKDLEFDELKVKAEWELKPHFNIRFEKVVANNAYASANVHGGWQASGGPLGTLEVRGDLHYMQANEVHRYIPIVAGGKGTNDWLKAALRRGIASNGKVNLYGPLHLFPYTDTTQDYIFQITAQAEGLELDYVPTGEKNDKGQYIPGPWPLITDIKGFLDFKGMGFEIKAQSGKTMGATLSNVYASIPNYAAPHVPLVIRGQGAGPLQQMAAWVNESPVSKMLSDIFVGSTATGDATLKLALDIPILQANETQVIGEVTVAGNDLHIRNVPPLTDAHGIVGFSERGVWASALQAKVFGVDTLGSIRTDDQGTITINANVAEATVPAIDQIVALPIVSNILTLAEGTAAAQVEVKIKNGVDIHVESDLLGLGFNAPAPLSKKPDTAMPMRFDMTICSQAHLTCVPEMQLDIGSMVDMDFIFDSTDSGMRLKRGAVALNQKGSVPKTEGISLQMTIPNAEWAQWNPILDRLLAGLDSDAQVKDNQTVTLNNIRLKTNLFNFQDLLFADLSMVANADSQGRWHGNVTSDVAKGRFIWTPQAATSRPHIEADFERLYVETSKIVDKAIESAPKNPTDLPSLDVAIDDLRYENYQIGNVRLLANNSGQGEDFAWHIANLTVKTPEATLTASGHWNAGQKNRSRTQVEATLDINNLGQLLARAQVPEAVRDGHGQIHANLDWAGSPTQFAIGSLNGSISTALMSGQLLQVEPGAARLLSLLSLQSLLRRLTLDFRDVVGQGFVFDTINSQARIDQGILYGDSFRLVGPQATVLIAGDVNFNNSTQNVKVTVLPDISLGGPALALSLANPLVGVGSFIAQWALQAPLSKLFSLEYSITGSFDDPVIQKAEKEVSTETAQGP